jgi:hypothetical protein
MGARHRSANFIVETPDPRAAATIAETAERLRHDLAVEWLGAALPNWYQPCMMTVQIGPHLGAGGATTFVFDRGEVYGWRMNIQGSQERILDSVLPHEITHMIFASHFRQPLPRWADEGAATSVEHPSERAKHRQMLHQFLSTRRGIPFAQMFAMKEYPPDIMPLYAQAHSVAEYLIQLGGRRKYVEFVGDGLRTGDWAAAVARHYDLASLGTLQNSWLAWVQQGSPPLRPAKNTDNLATAQQLAAANPAQQPRQPSPAVGALTSANTYPATYPTTVPGSALASNAIASHGMLANGATLSGIAANGISANGMAANGLPSSAVASAQQPMARGRLVPLTPPGVLPASGWRPKGSLPAATTAPDTLAATTVFPSAATASDSSATTVSPPMPPPYYAPTATGPTGMAAVPRTAPATTPEGTVRPSLAHPHPIGRPKQIILEWARP